ncbi:hypothetical protein GGI43DRAFT_418877 [Trichoderma evansii]
MQNGFTDSFRSKFDILYTLSLAQEQLFHIIVFATRSGPVLPRMHLPVLNVNSACSAVSFLWSSILVDEPRPSFQLTWCSLNGSQSFWIEAQLLYFIRCGLTIAIVSLTLYWAVSPCWSRSRTHCLISPERLGRLIKDRLVWTQSSIASCCSSQTTKGVCETL